MRRHRFGGWNRNCFLSSCRAPAQVRSSKGVHAPGQSFMAQTAEQSESPEYKVPDNVMDQVVTELRQCGSEYYPENGELRNIRIVGHTPKNDHYIYDVVIDFAAGSERLAAKVYRNSKCGPQGARGLAKLESSNLQRVYQLFQRKKLSGVPRPIGDFTELGAVVTEKFSGLPLQSIIMKAALLPGYADRGTLTEAASRTGEWLRAFHRVTADMPQPFDAEALLRELERLCANCKGEGLDDAAIRTILSGTRSILARLARRRHAGNRPRGLSPRSRVARTCCRRASGRRCVALRCADLGASRVRADATR